MDFLDDPEEMTPEERLDEIAAILAVGYLRLRNRGVKHAASPGTFTEKPLDCPDPPMPSCVYGSPGKGPAPVEVPA